MWIVQSLAWVFAASLACAAAYRALFASAYLLSPRASAPAPAADDARRFQVVVPAHNEELLIADLIASLRATQYPQDRISILVIADNCDDGTASVVRDLGEQVLERSDDQNRGKGQALAWTFAQLDLSSVDAVALFDADNLVAADFFESVNAALQSGERCIQGYYDIANPDESVMTRLLSVTYVMKNLLFNAGKSALGRSVLLMGTGMVFHREIIERYGWQAMTIGEDYEQSFNLVAGGERIRFLAQARTRAQESTTLRQGYAQRQRWLSGRRVLVSRAWTALVDGLRRGSLAPVDVALDLFLPTYSTMLSANLVGLALAALLLPLSSALVLVLAGVLVYQVIEVAIALWLMRAPPRFLLSLAFAPVFLVWRGVIDVLAVFGHRSDRWARTERAVHSSREDSTPTEGP